MAVLHRVRTPDLIEQLALRQHLAGAGEQGGQQPEFNRRQVQFLLVAHDLTIDQIHRDVRKANERGFLLGGAETAQRHPNPCQQLADAERFGEVIIGAGVQRVYLVLLVGTGGQHDNRNRAPLAQIPDVINTVAVGQTQIENNQIRFTGRGFDQSPLQRFSVEYATAFVLQRVADKTPDLFLIFYDQDVGL